jgi:hypothetical protein
MKFNKDLLQLTEDLNSLNLDNPENPIITSQDWPFTFAVNDVFSEIELFGETLVQEEHDNSTNRKEYLEEIKAELESWDFALQSALWSVNELLDEG